MLRLLPALLLLLGMVLPLQAQLFNENREYYDANWKLCDRSISSFYREVTRQSDTVWLIGDYYRFAGIQMSGLARRSDGTGRIGTWTWFHPNGRKSEEKTYVNDTLQGVATYWHDNGQISERGDYSKRRAVGIWKKWHPNGQLADSTFYDDGKAEGVSLQWHPNGQLYSREIYDHGEPVGIHRKWYEDGTLEAESRDRSNGAPSTWTWYDRAGRMTAIETYANGGISHPIYYEPDGTTHSDTARARWYGNAVESDTAFSGFVRSVKYPALDRDNNIEGTVLLLIQIKEDGSIGEVEIEVPATSGMNAEALRAIRALRFNPPRLHNKPWSFKMTLPVRFRLNG